MPETFHLVKVPFLTNKLAVIARRRGLPLRDLDEGYLAHCVLREIWQEEAPAPFTLKANGQVTDVWGYSPADASVLTNKARALGDQLLLSTVSDLSRVASKPVPRFAVGRRVGFVLRACPVVRLAAGVREHKAGAEVDAYLARCFAAAAGQAVSREGAYRDWLLRLLNNEAKTGARVERVSVTGMSRQALTRRTHGETRNAMRLERPDVHFEGTLEVVDGELLHAYLLRGVGRHRAFGFGALMLVPTAASQTR